MTPTLELLRQAFAAYQAGEIEAEHLLATLEEVADIVTGYLQELEASADDEPGCDQLVEAFDEHLEALEWLADHLEQPAPGLARIEAAVAQMVEAQHSLEEVAKALCPRCAQPNPVGSPRCGSCSVQLPSWHAPRQSTVSLSESAPPEPELLTEDFVRVATALERWRQGSGREAFEKTVESVRDSLERQRDRYHDFHTEDPATFQLRLRCLAAFEASLQALAKMLRAFETEDASYLDNGLADLREAARELVAGQK
ncbi:MAG: hypothetical protein AB7S38_38755 [Vulcanimicrobiota bacterium]